MGNARGRGRAIALLALCFSGCETAATTSQGDGGLVDAWRPDATSAVDAAVATPDASAGLDAPDADREAATADDGAGAPSDDGAGAPSDGGVPSSDVPGERCESATELRDGDVLTGQRFGGGPSPLPACSGVARAGPTRWYRADVPAGDLLVVEVTRERSDGVDVALTALESCGASTCLAAASLPGRTVVPLVYRNDGAAPRSVVVAVTGVGGAPEAVTVSARIRAPVGGASCLTAAPLTAGATLRGQDVAGSLERLLSCSPSPTETGRRALFYTTTVPARTALIVESHREDGVTGAPASYLVEVRPPCGAPGCFPTASADVSSAPVGQYNNASDAPQDVSVAVSGDDAFPAPVVDLTATLRALPSNHRCAAAVTLVDGAAVTIDHPEDATDPTPRCPGAVDAAPRALYYAINVPPGQSVDVGVDSPATPGAARYASVRLFTACGGACLAARTAELISPRVVYANGGASPQRVVVAAGGSAVPGFRTPLVLRASLRPTPANVACAGARPLAAGAAIGGIDLLDAQGASPCSGVGGRVLYFSAPVAPGATLTLTATGASSDPSAPGPTLSVIDGCGGVCLGQSTSPTLTYVHRGAAQTVIVAVGQPAGAPITDHITLSARAE